MWTKPVTGPGSTDLDALYFRGIILQAESRKENEEVKVLFFHFCPGLATSVLVTGLQQIF